MPTRPQILNQFSDVVAILRASLAHSGGAFTAPTYSKAVAFRQRCYTFMKQYREADHLASEFDLLTIKALPPKGLVSDPTAPIAVRIEVRALEGQFTPAEGPSLAAEEPLDVGAMIGGLDLD